MESSNVILRYIKQVASDLQVAQVILWNTSAQTSQQASTRRSLFIKPRPPSYKNDASDRQQVSSYHNNNYKKSFDAKNVYKNKERCQRCGYSVHIEGFKCPAKKYQCKSCHKYGHFYMLMLSKETSFIQAKETMGSFVASQSLYACDKSICGHSEDCSSSNESFCLQVKIQQSQAECKKIPTPSHLITNLAYKLKPHQTRKQHLRARLDTCADVNIMLVSVYKLVFHDPELKKLPPSILEIGIYTTDTVKIVGSCLFYWSTQTLRSYKK